MPDTRWLQDILRIADELQDHLTGETEESFAASLLLQRATERLLTIIGEAAKQLTDETRQQIPQPWREIVRFRDRGVHAYDSLSPRMVYRIATESVPALRAAIQAHLAK